MAFRFNVFTSNFDIVEGGQSAFWLPPVATRASLPSGDADGASRTVLAEDVVFVYDQGADEWHNTRLSPTEFSAAANAAGITIVKTTTAGTPSISDYKAILHKADASNPGGVSTDAQTFGGNKTFANDVIVTGDLTVNGTTTTLNTATVDVEDANITVNKNGNQSAANTNDAGITVEMSDATNAIIGYDSTTTSKWILGEVGSAVEVASVSHAQILTNKTLDGSSTGSNTINVQSVNSEYDPTGDNYIISTDVGGALGELDVQVKQNADDIVDRANRTLSNLTSPTAVNQSIIPGSDNAISIGSGSKRLAIVESRAVTVRSTLGGDPVIELITNATIPDGSSTEAAIRNRLLEQHLAIFTSNQIGSAGSNHIKVQTGNTENGDTGDVQLRPGIPTGTGTKGVIDATSSLISNVLDPVSNQDVATKSYVDAQTLPGDLTEVGFSIANNQATFANVTGVAFANGVTRSAEIQYSVAIDATADLYESGKIMAIQRGADWVISQSTNGDVSQVLFDMTTAGQLQYKSGNLAGFVSGTLKIRAITTSV